MGAASSKGEQQQSSSLSSSHIDGDDIGRGVPSTMTTTPWMFGRVASMLSDESGLGGGDVWQRHSSNFGTSLASSQKQSIEVLKYSKAFSSDDNNNTPSSSGGALSLSSTTKQCVPIMRIVGFFPGVSPRQVTQHLTNIHLRRRWDANYLAFDCIANFHHRIEHVHVAGSLFRKSCPSTLQEEVMASGEGSRSPWWCWTGAASLQQQQPRDDDSVSILDSTRKTLTRHLWGGMYPKNNRATIGATLSSTAPYPPPLLSSPADASTTLGLRQGFTLLQHTWARHCVGSHMLERFGFAPRSFLYELYVTRLQYPDLHKVKLPVEVELALNETLPYSTVYQGIHYPMASSSSSSSSATADVVVEKPSSRSNNSDISTMMKLSKDLSDKILSSLTRQKGGEDGGGGVSLAVPFSTVPVAMNYQEVLILPVFDVEADKERYLDFARTKGGSVFSDIPTVNYPWLTSTSAQQSSSSSPPKNGSGHSIKDMDFKAVVQGAEALQGSFMIMTACNDVKPPDMVPLWMEKAVSKFFTTGAYAALHNGIVSAIKEGEEK